MNLRLTTVLALLASWVVLLSPPAVYSDPQKRCRMGESALHPPEVIADQ
jgi:hypothetical protein